MRSAITVTNVSASHNYLSNVLATARDAGTTHGIGYWANIEDAEYDSRGLLRVLHLVEREGLKRYRVSHPKLTRGILVALQAGHVNVLKTDDLDGPTADTIIQFACFQELKYG